MKGKKFFSFLVLAFSAGGTAFAQDLGQDEALSEDTCHEPEGEGDEGMWIEPHIRLDNLFLFRNDSDFDRTPPHYNENGQTVGAFATILTPRLTWHLATNLQITYEVEIGLNYWSRNNPDTESALSPDVFVMKHREMFAEGAFFDGRLGFKAGYQRFKDSTGLFLNHWIGAAKVYYAPSPGSSVGLFVGQVPDQTYEGITVRHNNFKRDIMVFGLFGEVGLVEGMTLSFGLHNLYDSHVVGRTRYVIAPNVALRFSKGPWSAEADAILQAGRFEHSALDGGHQTVLAWAAQGHGAYQSHPWDVEVNLLALSPDDKYDGNGRQGAFLYSAKPQSKTRILTEDEVRDWYDNIDERMSTFEGGFFLNRAGLFLGDASIGYEVFDFFEPKVIVGAAMVLEPKNALSSRFVGIEALLDLTFSFRDFLFAHVSGGALIPGRAAAALVNEIDRKATDPIWMAELSLTVRY